MLPPGGGKNLRQSACNIKFSVARPSEAEKVCSQETSRVRLSDPVALRWAVGGHYYTSSSNALEGRAAGLFTDAWPGPSACS